jgi:WD40 repeat protein
MIRVYDVENNYVQVRTLKGHTSWVEDAIEWDNKWIISCSMGGDIVVWNLQNKLGKELMYKKNRRTDLSEMNNVARWNNLLVSTENAPIIRFWKFNIANEELIELSNK